ncbi:MAG: hypothetical protein DSZ11_01080 [Sulfurovum sp.]|nr:MAG: hypothetical protein DSZ11_01080 [Sulfurovum sp.]
MNLKELELKKYFYSPIVILTLLFSGCNETEQSSKKQNNRDENQKIFIIGDSTVHSHSTINLLKYKKMNCGLDNPNNELQGWGDALFKYMKHPENVINKARQGSNSLSFRTVRSPERLGLGRDWEGTIKQMRQNKNGGFLLIQFGSKNENGHTPKFDKKKNIIDYNHDGKGNKKDNKARINLRKTHFKENIQFYIDKAKELNITPVLITVPEARLKEKDKNGKLHPTKHRNTRGEFPNYMKEIAKEQNLQLLDLHSRTLQEFTKYSDEELRRKFGDCTLKNGYIDRTHYEPQGADRVAKMVKELACELKDSSLCSQFK